MKINSTQTNVGNSVGRYIKIYDSCACQTQIFIQKFNFGRLPSSTYTRKKRAKLTIGVNKSFVWLENEYIRRIDLRFQIQKFIWNAKNVY